MNKRESDKLDKLYAMYESLAAKQDEQSKKIDKLLDTITGDDLGNFEGLISSQKKDNLFRGSVTIQLENIIKSQADQLEINKKTHERLSYLENFANFFTTLSQIKRTTWIIIGALATGTGWLLMKIHAIGKWLTGLFEIHPGS